MSRGRRLDRFVSVFDRSLKLAKRYDIDALAVGGCYCTFGDSDISFGRTGSTCSLCKEFQLKRG